MPIFAESQDKIFGDILFDVVNDTNVSRTSAGSKTRAIAQATSKKLGRMWRQFDLNYVQAFLNGAEGKYLDYIGAMMGLPRLGEIAASVTSSQRLVRFYVDTGDFGSINSGASIYIPAGEIISTGAGETGILYRLTNSVYLPLDSSELFVSVEAINSGVSANVGAGQLSYHQFTTYTDSFNGSLKVTNSSDIFTGQSVEADTNYKFRIANQVIAAEQGNLTAVRLAALIVPGVADVSIIPYYHGIGTFDLMVKATTPSVPTSLLSAVAESVYKVTSHGNVPNIRAPIEIGMSMTGTLTTRSVISNQEQANLIDAVSGNVTDYINNLDISEEFIVNEVVERVMSTSDLIKNIGSAGKPLDFIYIHRPSTLEDNKVRSTLLGDFDPEADEKLLVENRFAGDIPIQFRIA